MVTKLFKSTSTNMGLIENESKLLADDVVVYEAVDCNFRDKVFHHRWERGNDKYASDWFPESRRCFNLGLSFRRCECALTLAIS